MVLNLKEEIERAKQWEGTRKSGRVTRVIGLLITSCGPDVSIGEICLIYDKRGRGIPAQVVGFQEEKILLMALGEVERIFCGAEVFPCGTSMKIGVGEGLLGRVVDALGAPLDGKGEVCVDHYIPQYMQAPLPLERRSINRPLVTGVKAIDTLFTIGEGQRMGIFSGSGVGKSTLLGMIAKYAEADLSVIALIGERGREVKEFIEKQLGSRGLARSIVVVATSDQPALLRSLGAERATAIAEYFRDRGKKVLLLVDSMSRFAMARREIGLASGEPQTSKGYPPSLFAILPRLLERAGNTNKGSITGIYTALAEGDDAGDPIVDQMRSLLDGHLFLTRELASSGHYPAIDPLQSLSRLMPDLVGKGDLKCANGLKEHLFHYKTAEELINIGAYVGGSNPKIDGAISKIDAINGFLRQERDEFVPMDKSWESLRKIIR